jgi:hypothetical protein
MLFPLGTEDVARGPRCLRKSRLDFAGIFGRVDQRDRVRIVDPKSVAARPQHSVERDRHDSGFNRTPEKIEKRGTILHHHQYAVSVPEPKLDEAIRTTINVGCEFGVCDNSVARANYRFGATAFRKVSINERNSHIVIWRESQTRVALRYVDIDYVTLHRHNQHVG